LGSGAGVTTNAVAGEGERPRLLFLCQTLPYPPDGGVNIRTYHVLSLLARAFEIDALCFYRRSDRVNNEAVEAGLQGLLPFAHVEAFPIPQELNAARLLWDHARSLVHGRAYTMYAYDSSAFRTRVRELLASRRYALAHMDSLDLATYLPILQGLPVVCVHHNIESLLLSRRARGERSLWRRAYVALQARLLARLERAWCGRVALNVVVSEADGRELNRMVPGAPVVVVPNGVDVTAFRPESGRDEGLVFVGGSNWFPNRDALEYFCHEILPHIRRRCGEGVPVRWVGRCTDGDVRSYGDRYGIELTGYVNDIRPFVRDAACYIVPMRVGGGTRLKILDAWAMGKAVVSTSIGSEGLAVADGVNILTRDRPEEFAEAVRTVLTDKDLRLRLARNARDTAERSYSWDLIGSRMLSTYGNLIDAARGSRTRQGAHLPINGQSRSTGWGVPGQASMLTDEPSVRGRK
jgi:glycosyltransferase involved in cell wall biosynthesis